MTQEANQQSSRAHGNRMVLIWGGVAVLILIVAGIAGLLLGVGKQSPRADLLDFAVGLAVRDNVRFKKYLTADNRAFFDRQIGSLQKAPTVLQPVVPGLWTMWAAELAPILIVGPNTGFTFSNFTISQRLDVGKTQLQITTAFREEHIQDDRAFVDGVNTLVNSKGGQGNVRFRYILRRDEKVWKLECLLSSPESYHGAFPDSCPTQGPPLPLGGAGSQGIFTVRLDFPAIWQQLLSARGSESQSQVSTDESGAVATLRAMNEAEAAYASAYKIGFSDNLTRLGPPLSGQPNAESAGLLEAVMAGRSKDGTPTSFSKYGYVFLYEPQGKFGSVSGYKIHARPIAPGQSGTHWFYTDQTAVIRISDKANAGPDSPAM